MLARLPTLDPTCKRPLKAGVWRFGHDAGSGSPPATVNMNRDESVALPTRAAQRAL